MKKLYILMCCALTACLLLSGCTLPFLQQSNPPAASPSITPTETPQPSATPAPSPMQTSSAPMATPSPSPTATPTPSPINTPSPSPSASPTPSPTATPTPTPTPTATTTPKPTATPQPTPKAVKITLCSINMDTVYATINAEYPAISGMKDTAFQNSLNNRIEATIQQRIQQLRQVAKQEYDNAVEDGDDYKKFLFNSNVMVKSNTAGILSLQISVTEYTGGAHSYGYSVFYSVLNASPAKDLKLPNLFTNWTAARTKIITAISQSIQQNPDLYYEGVQPDITDGQGFYLKSNSLFVVYPEYAIAPYAGGQPEFEIPLSKLKDLLIDALK